MHTFCTLFAHFLQQMIQTLQTSCTLILYLQTFCRTFAHFLQITCFHSAGFMHTFFRPDADLMQIKLMHCRILADSMHTLRRANQCHYNAAARPRGPAGEGGTPVRCPAGRRSGGSGRRSGGPRRRCCSTPVSAQRAPACGDGGAACVRDTYIHLFRHPGHLLVS
jgi:hypothetical protein